MYVFYVVVYAFVCCCVRFVCCCVCFVGCCVCFVCCCVCFCMLLHKFLWIDLFSCFCGFLLMFFVNFFL